MGAKPIAATGERQLSGQRIRWQATAYAIRSTIGRGSLGAYMILLAGAAFIAGAFFIATGGGLLVGWETGRFAGTERDFITCRYLTADGIANRRHWLGGEDGSAGCPLALPSH